MARNNKYPITHTWFWLAGIGRNTTSFTRVYAMYIQKRKPWKQRNMAWEAYIRAEKRFADDPIQHTPAQFYKIDNFYNSDVGGTWALSRKPWKKANTYQIIERLTSNKALW